MAGVSEDLARVAQKAQLECLWAKRLLPLGFNAPNPQPLLPPAGKLQAERRSTLNPVVLLDPAMSEKPLSRESKDWGAIFLDPSITYTVAVLGLVGSC